MNDIQKALIQFGIAQIVEQMESLKAKMEKAKAGGPQGKLIKDFVHLAHQHASLEALLK